MTLEEEDEFNKEFAKLLVDQSDAKKSERKVNIPVFDSAVPLMRRAKPAGVGRGGEEYAGPTIQAASTDSMRFMLLTKKGNKPQVRRQPLLSPAQASSAADPPLLPPLLAQTRMMEIPVDSAIAVSTRSNQMLDKMEQQQMKKLVLEQDRRQDDSEKRGRSPRHPACLRISRPLSALTHTFSLRSGAPPAMEAAARARGIKLRFVDQS